jgi:integral membrane protein
VLSTPVGRFRLIALLEGVSFLVLLLVAMPIKYVGGNPAPVYYAGWVHGGLYILFGITGVLALIARGWPPREGVRAFVASVLPCGTFVYDAVFLRREYEAERKMRAGEVSTQA